MRLDVSMIRMFGLSMLGIVIPTAVVTAVIVDGFADVPEVRYLVPIVALWTGLLVISWLALVLGLAIRTRFSRTAGPLG